MSPLFLRKQARFMRILGVASTFPPWFPALKAKTV
jgi:hypothetical protein